MILMKFSSGLANPPREATPRRTLNGKNTFARGTERPGRASTQASPPDKWRKKTAETTRPGLWEKRGVSNGSLP